MKTNYVKVEFEEEGDIYEYRSLDSVVAGDFVIVETPKPELKSVKVLQVSDTPCYKGNMKWCLKDRFFEMELEGSMV